MIAGVGTDMIEVERVAEKISKGQGFKELVFSAAEITYCESKTHPYQHYAARFAAKEALLKALGTGWASGTAFNEIEIINDAAGKPSFHFLGETAQFMAAHKITNIAVSLSHVKSMATAVVIIEC